MATIGTMGDVTFSVSRRRVRTFDDFTRDGGAALASHDVIGEKSDTEYTGLDSEEVSLTIQLRADDGVNPSTELKKLRKMRDKGKVFPVIIGGQPLSNNNWIIESLSENVGYWTRRGRIQSAKVSVKLKEYKTDSAVTQSPQMDISSQIEQVVETVQDKIDTAEDKIQDMTGGLF